MDQAHPTVNTKIVEAAHGRSVATITVDNSRRLNILGSRLIEQLSVAAGSLGDRDDIGAVILTGAGDRAFIGGADVNEMAGLDQKSAREFIIKLHLACEAVRNIPVPVIARISGYCLGAGLEIAASCDLRIASKDSSFGMPEVKVGIPSVIEAALLPALIGWGRTRLLLYTGETIPAEVALGVCRLKGSSGSTGSNPLFSGEERPEGDAEVWERYEEKGRPCSSKTPGLLRFSKRSRTFPFLSG